MTRPLTILATPTFTVPSISTLTVVLPTFAMFSLTKVSDWCFFAFSFQVPVVVALENDVFLKLEGLGRLRSKHLAACTKKRSSPVRSARVSTIARSIHAAGGRVVILPGAFTL
jgi:hypothetical protein